MTEFETDLEDAKRGVRHRYNLPEDSNDPSISIMAFTEILVAECYRSISEEMTANNKRLLEELKLAEWRIKEGNDKHHEALLNEIQKIISISAKPARTALAQLTSYAKSHARDSVTAVVEEAKVDILNSSIAVMKEAKKAMTLSLIAAVCTAAIFAANFLLIVK